MTNRAIDHYVAELAHRQFGVFARRQVVEHGATDGIVTRRVAAGVWVPIADGVYRLDGFASCWRASLMTAVLGTAGFVAVSHESAAALHGFAAFPSGPVVTTVRHGAGRVRGSGFVHQLDDLLPEHVETRDGLPVTTPARTFVDLAAVCRRGRLAHALDDALTAGTVDLDAVIACVDSVARRGKPGIRLLRVLLADHLPGYVPPATALERLLLRVLRDGGLPRPALQYPFPGRCTREARVDAAYPEARLVIEADSRRWHTRRQDFQRDRERDNRTVLAGWRVLRFTWEDLTRNPESVSSSIYQALQTAA